MTSDTPQTDLHAWTQHFLRVGSYSHFATEEPAADGHLDQVEPWLSALFQAEHLNLLVGSGLTTALAKAAQAPCVDMSPAKFELSHAAAVDAAAKDSAQRLGRNEPNLEDQIRAARELIGGLRIFASLPRSITQGKKFRIKSSQLLSRWESAVDDTLGSFLKKVLDTERSIRDVLSGTSGFETANEVRRLLGGFLLPFASRALTRDRLHIFTTNYDRVIEYGCDLLGLRIIDRFVGNLVPRFRSSRLGIDLHYNPPGIRGEPRYLEGVIRLAKLHGSVDWRYVRGPSGGLEVQRCGLPFGADAQHPEIPDRPGESLLIYPNPAKDFETLEYPYSELFRDFAAATCQPNSVVVTYGYGFGDHHVNRVLWDMLTIPSTHLVIISFDHAGGRLKTFCDHAGRESQISLLVGSHFGDLRLVVEHYLPKPAIDRTTWKMMDLLRQRQRPQDGEHGSRETASDERGGIA